MVIIALIICMIYLTGRKPERSFIAPGSIAQGIKHPEMNPVKILDKNINIIQLLDFLNNS